MTVNNKDLRFSQSPQVGTSSSEEATLYDRVVARYNASFDLVDKRVKLVANGKVNACFSESVIRFQSDSMTGVSHLYNQISSSSSAPFLGLVRYGLPIETVNGAINLRATAQQEFVEKDRYLTHLHRIEIVRIGVGLVFSLLVFVSRIMMIATSNHGYLSDIMPKFRMITVLFISLSAIISLVRSALILGREHHFFEKMKKEGCPDRFEIKDEKDAEALYHYFKNQLGRIELLSEVQEKKRNLKNNYSPDVLQKNGVHFMQFTNGKLQEMTSSESLPDQDEAELENFVRLENLGDVIKARMKLEKHREFIETIVGKEKLVAIEKAINDPDQAAGIEQLKVVLQEAKPIIDQERVKQMIRVILAVAFIVLGILSVIFTGPVAGLIIALLLMTVSLVNMGLDIHTLYQKLIEKKQVPTDADKMIMKIQFIASVIFLAAGLILATIFTAGLLEIIAIAVMGVISLSILILSYKKMLANEKEKPTWKVLNRALHERYFAPSEQELRQMVERLPETEKVGKTWDTKRVKEALVTRSSKEYYSSQDYSYREQLQMRLDEIMQRRREEKNERLKKRYDYQTQFADLVTYSNV